MGIHPLWHLPSTSRTFGVSWVQAPIAITPPLWRERAEMNFVSAQLRHSPSPACAVIPGRIPEPKATAGASRQWGWPGAGRECLAGRHRRQHRLLFPDRSVQCRDQVNQGSQGAAGTAEMEAAGPLLALGCCCSSRCWLNV